MARTGRVPVRAVPRPSRPAPRPPCRARRRSALPRESAYQAAQDLEADLEKATKDFNDADRAYQVAFGPDATLPGSDRPSPVPSAADQKLVNDAQAKMDALRADLDQLNKQRAQGLFGTGPEPGGGGGRIIRCPAATLTIITTTPPPLRWPPPGGPSSPPPNTGGRHNVSPS